MSVTFWVPEAPRTCRMVPCDFAGCAPGRRCGYCVDGQEERWESPAPDLNLCNGNAATILALLGEHDGLYGDWTPNLLAGVRRKIVRWLNVPLAAYARASAEYGGDGQARVYIQGLDEEGIRDRFRRLDAVLAYAQANGQKVSWQ